MKSKFVMAVVSGVLLSTSMMTPVMAAAQKPVKMSCEEFVALDDKAFSWEREVRAVRADSVLGDWGQAASAHRRDDAVRLLLLGPLREGHGMV